MTAERKRQLVKISVLEYDDKYVAVPLIGMCFGLAVGFTAIFNPLGYILFPISVFVIYSIISGDISLVDEDWNQLKHYESEEE